jgi:adenosylcobinamide-GDP ribazoletransferase
MAAEATSAARRLSRLASDCALAVAFLTIAPVRASHGSLNRAAAWFALVGAVVGALAGGMRAMTEPLFGATLATVLAIGVLVVLTGGLHQDGLADMADGLGVRGDRERRLAAMRDPAVGAFGALALLGWGLLLVAALAPLSASEAVLALVVAGAVGRWTALVHAWGGPPARGEGLGAAFVPTPATLAFATVTAIGVAWLACGALLGILAVAAGLAAAAVSTVLGRRVLGGRTGDTLGATVVLAEVAVCMVLMSSWR